MRRFFVPFSILIAALAVDREWFGSIPPSWLSLPIWRLVFGLVFLVAWRFRRGRAALLMLTVAAIVEATQAWGLTLGNTPPSQRGAAVVLLGTAWLLWLALLPWLSEWRFLSWPGVWRFAALAVTGLTIGNILTAAGPYGLTLRQVALRHGPIIADWPAAPLPHLLSAACFLSLVSLLWGYLKRPWPFEVGLLAIWLCASLACLRAWQGRGGIAFVEGPRPFLLAAGLILGSSLVEGAFSLAFEDGLTSLPARRALEESLLQLGPRYSLAMVDIDHFKKLNDRHGHEVGDQVLRMVAGMLRSVGGGGEAFRYGGEEFTILFPGKGLEEVEPHLETLRRQIAERRFAVRSPGRPRGKKAQGSRGQGAQGKTLRVTVSLGAAQRSQRAGSPEMVMKAADKALYRSKKGGRNRLTTTR